MITFWIVSALLMAGALLFVVPPLLGGKIRHAAIADHQVANLAVLRDQLRELETERSGGEITEEQYARARSELERRVIEESRGEQTVDRSERPPIALIAAIVILVPAIAIPLYLGLGTPAALNPTALTAQAGDGEGGHSLTPEQVEAMVEKLAARLKEKPDDVEGWVMLARTYNALGRYADAAEAFRTLIKLLPADAQLLADYADTLAMSRGRQLAGEPETIIAQALQIDARNVKALALAGTAAFEQKDYAKAIEFWERIAAQVEPNSPTARSVASSIAEARARMGGAEAPVAVASASVGGRVELAGNMSGAVGPEDTVFVFARAANGPRMPLAIVRRQVKDLPFDFKLDDSMAMTPAMRLSAFPQVVVGARISKSGNAAPQPGDIETLSTPVAPNGTKVRLLLGAKGSAADASPAPTAAPAAASVSGRVSLAPEVGGRVDPADTVFIFARAAEGPRMPLAILRKQVKDLPMDFKLDDSMAMTPAMRLSAFPRVVIGARISKSGDAAPRPGDFEAISAPMQSSAAGVQLVIGEQIQ